MKLSLYHLLSSNRSVDGPAESVDDLSVESSAKLRPHEANRSVGAVCEPWQHVGRDKVQSAYNAAGLYYHRTGLPREYDEVN